MSQFFLRASTSHNAIHETLSSPLLFLFFSGNFIVRQYLMLNAPNTEWSGKSFFFLSFMFSLASSTLTRVCERRDQKIFSMSEVLRREIFLEGWRGMMGLEKLMVS